MTRPSRCSTCTGDLWWEKSSLMQYPEERVSPTVLPFSWTVRFYTVIQLYKVWISLSFDFSPLISLCQEGTGLPLYLSSNLPCKSISDLDAHHSWFDCGVCGVVQIQLWVEPVHSWEQMRSLPSSDASFWSSTSCMFCYREFPAT